MDNKFKNSMGKWYTRALFFEETEGDKSSVLYTLKREDHLTYPSLQRLYLEIADPTEYRFAVQYLDCWAHWELIRDLSWFRPYYAEWQRELEVKIKSRALASIIDTATAEGNPNAYHANKYILEWTEKPAGALKRGRPSKDTTREQIIAQAASMAEIAEDAKRMGLN